MKPPLHSPSSTYQGWDVNGTSRAPYTQRGVMVGSATTALEPPRIYDISSEPAADPEKRIQCGSPKGKSDSMDGFGTSASNYSFQQHTVGRDRKEYPRYVIPKQQQDIATYSFTYHSLPSSPSPGGNIMAAGDRELGQAEMSQATPAGTQTGQDLPAGHSHRIRNVSDRDTDVLSCQVEEREGNDRDCSTLNGVLDQVFLGALATHQHTEPLQHSQISPLCIRKPQNETQDRPGVPDVLGPYPTALFLPAASPLTSLTSNQGSQMSKVVLELPKTECNQNHDSPSTPVSQGFTQKVWTWSLKSVDSAVGTGRDVEKSLPLDIVELQNSDHGQDVDIFSVSESTSKSRKEKRLSDNTKRKWTQKIKDRWKDRRGSLGKRGKEQTGVDAERKNEGDFPSQNQIAAGDHGVLMSNIEDVKVFQSACTTAHDDAPRLVTEDCDMPETARLNGEVDFGLGSFSLLEEILTGQKWARFLNPTHVDTPINNRPVVEAGNQATIPVGQNDQDNALSGLDQIPTTNNKWGFRLNDVSSVSERSITQMPTDSFVSTSTDIPESNLNKVQEVRSDHIQSEPMEHVQDQTNEVGSPGFLQSDFSFIKPAEVQDNSPLKSGIHLNRKRGHQLQESNTEGEQEQEQGELLDSGEAMKDPTTTQSKGDNSNLMMVLHPLKWSPSAHISARTPTLVPRGVLKHSISQDSQCSSSMETVTKKRRLEDSRRVRFSEDVVSIEPHVLFTDSEVDSEEDGSLEDDTSLFEDVKMEEVEEVIPARRHSRPSWMLALKKKHLGKKPH